MRKLSAETIQQIQELKAKGLSQTEVQMAIKKVGLRTIKTYWNSGADDCVIPTASNTKPIANTFDEDRKRRAAALAHWNYLWTKAPREELIKSLQSIYPGCR